MTTLPFHMMFSRLANVAAAAMVVMLMAVPQGAVAQAGKMQEAGKVQQAGNVQQAAVAIVAGGCFWCVESDFDKVPGILSTTSGYIGGTSANPDYKQVSAGGTGHAEAVKIVYDPKQISYERILHIFWRTTDPLTAGGQFCDRGDQYRNAIFYVDPAQRKSAIRSKAALQASGLLKGKIVTTIEQASQFHPAEGYHQNYAKRNPTKYKFYRWNCGRDQRVKKIWGKEAFNF